MLPHIPGDLPGEFYAFLNIFIVFWIAGNTCQVAAPLFVSPGGSSSRSPPRAQLRAKGDRFQAFGEVTKEEQGQVPLVSCCHGDICVRVCKKWKN